MESSVTEFVVMSWYLTIRSDPTYSRSVAGGPLVEFLRSLPELVQTGPQEFRNSPGSPWVVLCFADADAVGCYSIRNTLPTTVNVVELICGSNDEEWYASLARQVAAFLRWEAVEEHNGRIFYPAG